MFFRNLVLPEELSLMLWDLDSLDRNLQEFLKIEIETKFNQETLDFNSESRIKFKYKIHFILKYSYQYTSCMNDAVQQHAI